MRYRRVSESGFRSHFGIAGENISVIIAPDLRAYPFAVWIFIHSRVRRFKTVYEIAERNSFGGAISVFLLIFEPRFGNVRGGEILAVFPDYNLIENDIVCVVVPRHA